MRVGSVSTGALRISWRQNLPILRAPVPRPVDPQPTLTPRSDSKRPIAGLIASGAAVRAHQSYQATQRLRAVSTVAEIARSSDTAADGQVS
jgi:hypothetical protein